MSAPSRLETLHTLRVANLDVAFATAFVTLFSGSLLVGFVQYLAHDNKAIQDFWVGMIAAVPAVMGLMQIPGAILGRASESFKRYVSKGGLWWRLLFLPVVALPLLPLPDTMRLALLVGCLGAAAFSQNLVNPIYNEWIGHIVPERNRGWYFSQRTLIATITGMIVGLVGAWILDRFKGTPYEPAGYTTIYGLGWACGMLSMYYFLKMHDSTRAETAKPSWAGLADVVREPLADKNFRNILIFVAVFMFSQGFAGNLFAAFALESLKMDFFVLQMTAVAAAIGTIATVRVWGFLADKYGNKPLLILLGIGVMLTPLLWVACVPGEPLRNSAVLIGGHVFNGIAWSGVGIVQMNMYLAASAPEKRANYLAAALTVSALALAVSPLAGAFMLNVLRAGMQADLAYKVVFVTVVAIRFIAVLTLLPIREPGAVSFRDTMRQISQVRPKGFAALRTLRRSDDARVRQGAIRDAGRAQLSMATTELAAALSDPVPRVRREAATALGRIASEDAATALARHAKENPDLVDEETLEAMGETGSATCIPLLVGFLTDPSALLRRSAAKALGKIGHESAIPHLIESAILPGDPDLRRAAIQALRNMGYRQPDIYGDALLDRHVSIRIAAAEAISELEMRELAEGLRHALSWYSDEGSAEMAYALATVGDPSDTPLIVEVASQTVSGTKRRRCLLALAKLYGIERDIYRLLAMDEVNRDTQLLALVRGHVRKDKLLKRAMDEFSSGEEQKAVATLAKQSELAKHLATAEVPESFLVAVVDYARHTEDRKNTASPT